ncbi:MAG: alpha/beta fold hydrolase [Acidimicrobiales bacterium]
MEDQIREIDRADGAVLRVETAGDGSPVVLLHGTMAGRSAFAKLRSHLVDTHHLVLPVGRGHEGTPAVFPDDYSLDGTEVGDLEAVLDELDLAHVDIVGHSTGGAVGLAFALTFPHRVRRLVMIEPTVLSRLPPAVTAEIRRASETTIAHAKRGDHRAAVASVLEMMGGEGWTSLPAEAKDKTLDAMAPVAEIAGPHVQALLDLSVTDQQIADLSTPALLIYGESTTIFFEAHIAARFTELRPDIEQVVVDGAGHNSQLERHEVVGPRIAAFLAASSS